MAKSKTKTTGRAKPLRGMTERDGISVLNGEVARLMDQVRDQSAERDHQIRIALIDSATRVATITPDGATAHEVHGAACSFLKSLYESDTPKKMAFELDPTPDEDLIPGDVLVSQREGE